MDTFEDYLARRKAEADKLLLWCCPKCGIIGRLAHRYMAPWPKPSGDDVGECNPEYIATLKGLKANQ